MTIFLSPHADIIMAVLSCALLLAGAIAMVIARERSLVRPLPAWRHLGAALLLLGFREWIGVCGLAGSSPDFWHLAATLALLAAAAFMFAAVRAEAPPDCPRLRLCRGGVAVLLLASLIITGAPYFRLGADAPAAAPLVGISGVLLAKGTLFVVSLLLICCSARGVPRPSRRITAILAVNSLHAFLILICVPPGLFDPAGAFAQAQAIANPVFFLLRAAAAAALAVMLWEFYSRAMGVTGGIRWRPIALLLFIVAAVAAFAVYFQKRHADAVNAHLLAAAEHAADVIPPDLLLSAAADRGSANTPAVGEALFGKARNLAIQPGYARLRLRVDAVVFPAGADAPPVPVVDAAAGFGDGRWAARYAEPGGGRPLPADHPVLINGNFHGHEPLLAAAPVRKSAGDIIGAAVLTASAADAALGLHQVRRPVIIFLPLGFCVLLLILSGQWRTWLYAQADGLDGVVGQTAPGGDLTGVLIVRDGRIADCNRRFLALAGLTREGAVGAGVESVFAAVPGEAPPPAGQGDHGGQADPEMFSADVRRPDGAAVRLIVRVRPFTGDAGDRRQVWEMVDISEWQAAEDRLREKLAMAQAILDAMPDGAYLQDEGGRIRLANRAFRAFLRLPPEAEVEGRSVREVAPRLVDASEEGDVICRETPGETLVFCQSINHGGGVRHFEIAKTLCGLEGGGWGIIGGVRDLTRHKEDLEALEHERRLLVQLLDALPMSVCFTDREGNIRLCDHDFSRDAGYESPGELVGRRYADVSPYGPAQHIEDAKLLERGYGFSDLDFELVRDGEPRSLKVRRVVLTDADGRPVGLVKAFWDTTELMAATHAARKADRVKAAFLANMSHELRTPMNGIVGMADLIIDHESTRPTQRLYAETIIRSAQTLQMVMDEVMDIAAVDDPVRRFNLASGPFPLLALTEEAVRIAGCIIEPWGGGVHLSYDFALPGIHRGDARHVRQILVQTIAHCSRLSADKRVRLEVSAAGGGDVCLRVLFPPPPEIDLDGIAELFRQPGGGGNSLGIFDERIGLPLLWRLIDAMHGSLEVRGGVGAVICEIVLPLRRDPAETPPVIQAPDFAGLLMLVATADAQRYAAAQACLAYAGADVIRAVDLDAVGRLAEKAAAAGSPLSALILDGELAPDAEMAGFMAELRGAKAGGNPPIALITSSGRAQSLGALPDNVKTLILPPVLPGEMWRKAEMLLRGDSLPGVGREPGKSGTTVVVNHAAARLSRRVKVPARVLLVEDNTVNQMVAVGILKRVGCTTVLANNGLEAVKRIEGGDDFDLVFMDCLMPTMDGYEATSRIRMYERLNTGTSRNIIIALTANSVAGDREKCMAAGMDGYITKPVTLELLRSTLTRYCPNLVTLVDQTGEI